MRKFGLADGLGLVATLVAIVWLPGAADPLTYVKLLVLGAGGAALLPFVIFRWKALARPSWPVLIPLGSVGVLIIWGVVSTVGSGAPLWNSVFGWWGRGDGWLAWFGAAVLLVGAAGLRPQEIGRAVAWLLGGASLVAVIGVMQFLGADIPQGASAQVSGTMGNTNFAAGYFAIVGVLALGKALSPGKPWERAWGGALFVVVAFLAWQTASVQGPAALAAGLLALAVCGAILYQGRLRWVGLVLMGVVAAGAGAIVVVSFVGSGPLAGLWTERTFAIRQQYWQSAVNIMNGLPVFGTGPDGFSRYVAEYRPESYVELLGPVLRVSAAHNIALQFGAVAGYVGLALWLITFVGIAVLLVARLFRGSVRNVALTASVGGAFVAYLVQGMVSIDMLPLLAIGWLVAGLTLGCIQESSPVVGDPEPTDPPVKKTPGRSKSAQRQESARVPAWAPISSGIGALLIAVLVGSQISLTNQIQGITSQEQALDFVTNPMTPCVLRVQVTQQIIQQLPADVSVPTVLEATDLDRRCPPIINFASDVLTQQQRFQEAAPFTEEGISIDPLFDLAWVLRSRYYLGVGDVGRAADAAVEAQRVQSLYPEGGGDPALLQALLAEIQGAR